MDTIRGGWCVLPVLLLAISSFMTISSRHTSVAPWCVMIDYVLVGFEDAINQTKTQRLCHNACKDSSWCESSNYKMASEQCQLINASHYDDSGSLVSSKGWVYSYTCTKVSYGFKVECSYFICSCPCIYPARPKLFLYTVNCSKTEDFGHVNMVTKILLCITVFARVYCSHVWQWAGKEDSLY